MLLVTAALLIATAVAGALTAAFADRSGFTFAGWLFFTAARFLLAAGLLLVALEEATEATTVAAMTAVATTATKAAVTPEAAAATVTATGFSLRLHTNQHNGHNGQREHRAEHISVHRNSSKDYKTLPDNFVVFGSAELIARNVGGTSTARQDAVTNQEKRTEPNKPLGLPRQLFHTPQSANI